MEFRNWTQGVTFCTRMDYLVAVLQRGRLLPRRSSGCSASRTTSPRRRSVMRVLLMELNRISSHLVCIATGGMEIGALTVMTIGFRERELVLDLFELITGLRMNHAFIRPGGVAQDMPPGALEKIREFIELMQKRLPEYAALCNANPIFKGRLGRRRLPRPGRLPGARRHRPGAARDRLRRGTCARRSPTAATRPTTSTSSPGTRADAYGRFRIRLDEMWESLQDRRAVRRPAAGPRGRAGDGRRQEDRLAEPARGRLRRHGQLARPHPPHHGRVDGGADPPLQAGHRGLPGAGRPGLRRGRVAARRARPATSSPTAAPGPTARTSATRRSSTCRPRRR